MTKKKFLTHTPRRMNRRSFLKLSGLLGLGLGSASIVPATVEAVKFNRKMYKVSKTRLAMGTFVSMTLFHSSRDKAEEAMGLAYEEMDRLAGLMNRYDEATALSQLNREGYLKGIPPELKEVVSRALYYNRISYGTFDISVKPVVDLFKEKFGQGKNAAPTEEELGQALELVGSENIELRGRAIHFKKPGMGITLDGIAKGYIVDCTSKILAKQNIGNHLINAGGDIRTTSARADKKPWTVAIQDPRKRKIYPDIIHMGNGSIATSGNYEIYFDREKMFHHIVDPRTGLSPELSASVSVMAKTALEADALSTGVFVMNPTVGTHFIDSIPKCECFVIDKADKSFKSAGWKSAAI